MGCLDHRLDVPENLRSLRQLDPVVQTYDASCLEGRRKQGSWVVYEHPWQPTELRFRYLFSFCGVLPMRSQYKVLARMRLSK